MNIEKKLQGQINALFQRLGAVEDKVHGPSFLYAGGPPGSAPSMEDGDRAKETLEAAEVEIKFLRWALLGVARKIGKSDEFHSEVENSELVRIPGLLDEMGDPLELTQKLKVAEAEVNLLKDALVECAGIVGEEIKAGPLTNYVNVATLIKDALARPTDVRAYRPAIQSALHDLNQAVAHIDRDNLTAKGAAIAQSHFVQVLRERIKRAIRDLEEAGK